ncbi:MAG: SPFH domain-containing protein [Isosphaeraceae bacterium]
MAAFAVGVGIFLLFLLFTGMFTVNQQSAVVIQRFGRFKNVAMPGLNFKVPMVDTVAGRLNLRVSQLDVGVETKTEDNVFVRVVVAVQYYVLPDKVYDAFYKLADPSTQITAFVFDVVRARVPMVKLDEVFERKDEIANAVKSELTQVMDDFGYGIVKALVTDIDPDHKVKEAMNEINAAQRLRVAANEKGEADRILKVKAAEAEAQSKALQGKGIADQRKAIVDGLRESVDEFQRSVPGTSAQDVMNLVLMTQYFDTLKELGQASRTNTILIPHSPGAPDRPRRPDPQRPHDRGTGHAASSRPTAAVGTTTVTTAPVLPDRRRGGETSDLSRRTSLSPPARRPARRRPRPKLDGRGRPVDPNYFRSPSGFRTRAGRYATRASTSTSHLAGPDRGATRRAGNAGMPGSAPRTRPGGNTWTTLRSSRGCMEMSPTTPSP